MEDVSKRRRISFSLSKLECGPQEINSGKFAYIFHFQQIGIDPIKIEKKGIHFKRELFAPSMLKLPSPSKNTKNTFLKVER